MIEYYGALKHIHMTAAALSIGLFIMRGSWMMFWPPLLQQQRWAKILPHVVDTILLVSAIALAIGLVQSGAPSSWLSGKLLGLVAYIVLGLVALKLGKTRQIRISAFVAALLVYIYVIGVAFSKQTWPF